MAWKSAARSLAAEEKFEIASTLLNSRFADSSVSAEMKSNTRTGIGSEPT
ncbi:unannotated protein [freshwater metagenome]|uniref:Unannotated protein n=1 Tax=freshwater metagenome TaxID=449393 RepID=A0A6J6CXW7_9ZZZZ